MWPSSSVAGRFGSPTGVTAQPWPRASGDQRALGVRKPSTRRPPQACSGCEPRPARPSHGGLMRRRPGARFPTPPSPPSPRVRVAHRVSSAITASSRNAGARRNGDFEIRACPSVADPAFAVLSALGLVMDRMAEDREVGELFVGDEDDVAATPTVAPVRPAARDVPLTAEGHRAHPAVPAFNVNPCPVGEGHRTGYSAGTASGCTNTRRPLRPLVTSTRPATVAKMV